MASMNSKPDVLELDPVELGITNRVAAGCTSIGHHQFQGGILVQGFMGGHIHILGDVVVWTGGMLEGTIEISGNLYLLGQLGREESAPSSTPVKVYGTVYAASTAISFATIHAKNIQLYEGAQLLGPFHTIPVQDDLFETVSARATPFFQPN